LFGDRLRLDFLNAFDSLKDINDATKRRFTGSERSFLAVSASIIWGFGALHLSGANESDYPQHETVLAITG
jgi:hypothetical protein